MMQNFQAKVSLGRVSASRGDGFIKLEVQDAVSGCHVLELNIDFATFGKLVTGASYLSAQGEIGNLDMLGCTQESKTVEVVYNHTCAKAAEKAAKDAACKPHEVDGWRLYRGDLGNYHKRAKGENTWNVGAHRFVRPDGSPIL
jgi:hypothetical protein